MTKEITDELARRLTDEGKLIEAGWKALRLRVYPIASQSQIDEMRMVFMAGAQHLWGSIISILDPGDEEPTAEDLRRMDLINAEMTAFYKEMDARFPGARKP